MMPILLVRVSADIRHNIAQACQAASLNSGRKIILSHRMGAAGLKCMQCLH